MNEDDKKTETEVTPEGTVEIQEEDLDQASGGAAYLKMPTDQVSMNYNKLEFDLTGQKVAPSDPSIGLLKGDPGKKI